MKPIITITKTGKIKIQTGKCQYQHKITFGDIVIFVLLAAWFSFDIIKFFVQ
jgi:hypothetical protein